ncbi:S1C family serine protease [Microlunatus sp. Gsoil 973]|uniref:S1C family serine protease n=1 Tax=Microlunatus sp. Gsoil 973 TaxID=2672569 RepID=UPI0012B4D375|nr:trypsin-like peptidase domain-containing protein [Microlunatus sp. Gsoil 973]QGN33281.1 PDZ domain-containing protein [Microlunatus sp. Gsoil 973]
MPGQRSTQRDRRSGSGRLRRVGAGIGAGVLAIGLVLGPAQAARAADLVDWSGHGDPGQWYDSDTATSSRTGVPATAAQSRGVVLINTELYTGSGAAGTGIVLSASGKVVTNYHVVEGSTAIEVSSPTTGRTYTATVLGADKTADVALLQLNGASGLATAAIDDDALRVGDDVTAVGNAGGTGVLTRAAGEVTALNQQITTQAEDTVSGETLTGLIQTDAEVQPGDSGGPLFDSENEVTGIDAAASSGGPTQSYAIPISTALGIVGQIQAGHETAGVRIGPRAYLGVQVTDATSGGAATSGGDAWGGNGGWGNPDPFQESFGSPAGAAIAGVGSGTAAERAGLEQGDVITRLGTTSIGSAADLTEALSGHQPGDRITVGWVDEDGLQQSATVTLGSSPVN